MNQQDKRIAKGNHTINVLMRSAEEILTLKENTNDLTVDDICRHCRMTKGAFYHHFPNKQAFFQRLYTLQMSTYIATVIDESEKNHPDDLAAQLADWIQGIAVYTLENRTEMSKYLYKGQPSEYWADQVSVWAVCARAHLIKWQEAGKLRTDVSAQALHQYMDSFTYGMSSLAVQGYVQLPLQKELVDSFIQTMLAK